DRPDALNALNRELLTKLRDRLRELAEDPAVRVVVLTGAGDRAFAAGADIKEMEPMSVDEARGWGQLGHECGRLLETMPKPTIAAINGFALGGGCELALACDLRYASSRAKLGQPEVNIGIIPGWGGTQRLARVVGLGVAKDLVLTGRTVDAEEALSIGLVNAVFGPEELLQKTLSLPDSLAAKSPLVLRVAKRWVEESLQGARSAGLAEEGEQFAQVFDSADQKEGMRAFVDKREPDFKAR